MPASRRSHSSRVTEEPGGVVRVAEPHQPRVVLAGGRRERVDVVAEVAVRHVDDPRAGGGAGRRVEPVGRRRLDDHVARLEEGVDDRGDERLDPVARHDPVGRRAQPAGHALAQVGVRLGRIDPRALELGGDSLLDAGERAFEALVPVELDDLVEPVRLLQLLQAGARPVGLEADQRRADDPAPVGHDHISRSAGRGRPPGRPRRTRRPAPRPAPRARRRRRAARRRLDERAEVGLDEVDARRLAELVALVLAQDPVAAVVDEQELRVEPVLARGGELGDPVVEAAVAGDGEHLRPGAASEAPSAAGQA